MKIFDMQPFILALTLCLGTAVQANPQAPPDGAVQDEPVPARPADLKPPPSLPVLDRIGSPGLVGEQNDLGRDGRRRKVLVGPMILAPRGDVVTIAGDPEIVWLWSAMSLKKEKIGRLTLPIADYRVITFSPDGRRLAFGDGEAGVSMLDARSLRKIWAAKRVSKPDLVDLKDPSDELAVPDFGPGMVTALAFSPDGSTIAAGGFGVNQAISIRDAATGRELRRLAKHAGPVYSLAFAPDGKILASASEDATIRIWDPAAGRELRRIRGHESNVYSLAFAPDGKTIASASGDKTVRI